MSSMGGKPHPSRMSLQILRQKRHNAFVGYSLLKRRSDALAAKFRLLLRATVEGKEKMMEDSSEANFALANAVWSAGDFRNLVLESVKRSPVSLHMTTENVAGVILPKFSLHCNESVDVVSNLAMASGGNVINSVKKANMTLLETLVNLASLQVSFMLLEEQMLMTNRRVNALDNVVLPAIDHSIDYITKELDELEREELYRLKMIRNKNIEIEEQEVKSRRGQCANNEPKMVESVLVTHDQDIVV